MPCKPTIYKAIPPFLTMRTKQRTGTRVTVTRVFDIKTKQYVFATYKGDMRSEFKNKKEIVGVFETRSGVWKKITGKGERVAQVPRQAVGIAKEIKNAGGRALLVGGGVRDALLGAENKDYDLEIYGVEPGQIENIINSLNPDFVDTVGRSFGVIKARFGNVEFDISIPRSESKNGEGHKGFEIKGDPNMDPREAARRRDFTMNALAQDPLTGEIVDYFGGHKDLAKGILRATDTETFKEDPLRVLRAAQFAGRFNLTVDKKTMQVMREMTKEDEFKNLPSARIGEEWKKLLLKSIRPSVGLEVGLESGAYAALHPELANLKGTLQEEDWHPEGDVWEHTKMAADVAAEIIQREKLEGDDALVIMLASLLHDIGKPETTEFKEGKWRAHGHQKAGVPTAKKFLSRMNFGKEIEKRVAPLVQEHMFLAMNKKQVEKRDLTKASVNRLSSRLEPSSIQELILVMEADVKGRGSSNAWREEGAGYLIEKAQELKVENSKPNRLLMGKHLIIHFNAKPGHQMGNVLDQVYNAQLDGTVDNFDDALNLGRILLEEISRTISGS